MKRTSGVVLRPLGRLGGLIAIGGWLLFAITGVIAAGGGAVGIGGPGVGSLVLAAAVALIAIGFAVIAVVGPRPLQARTVRCSLGALAVGLSGTTAGALISASSPGDPLENGPVVILVLGGGLVIGLGTLATVLSMLRIPGPTRKLALVFLGGLLSAWAAGALVNILGVGGPLQVLASALAVGGGAAVVAAGAGIGVLAIGRAQAPAATSA